MSRLERVDHWVRPRPWLADVVLAVVLAVVVGWSSVTTAADAGTWAPVLVGALVVAHALVAVRRLVPRTAFAATAALMALVLVLPDVPLAQAIGAATAHAPPLLLPSVLVFHVQLYTVASRLPTPWPTLALVIGLVGAGAATLRLAVPGDWLAAPSPARWWAFALAALVASVLAAWSLGLFRATRAAYVAALEDRARRAESDRAAEVERAAAAEREHIAREMHDVVAHSLAVMVRQAEGGRRVAATAPERALDALEAVAEAGREALADMRTALGALGAARSAAPQPGADDVPGLVEGMARTGVRVVLEAGGGQVPLDRGVSLAVYRVVQEALTNVAKHAPGATVHVRVDRSPREVEVVVRDDGGGRTGDRTPGGAPVGVLGSGRGLVGLRERVSLLGGTFRAGPVDGGFRVRAVLPAAGSGTRPGEDG